MLNGRGTDTPRRPRASLTARLLVYGSGVPSTDNTYRWLSGEDDPAFGGAIRDMWRPECYNDPGKVTSANTTAAPATAAACTPTPACPTTPSRC